MPEHIAARVRKAIDERVFPGCVVGTIQNGKRSVLPFGDARYGGPPIDKDAVYDLASVTKSIPVAALAARFISHGALSLSDKVVSHLPDLKHHQDASIEDLLLYRVSGPRLSTLADKTPDEIRSYIFETGLERGEEKYTNLPAFLLGLILEKCGGASLDKLAEREYFGPLGMRATSFFPTSDTVPTEVQAGIEVRGLPHDESARVFAKKGQVVGHAGLFSNADDLLRFLEMMLESDTPEATAAERGLGWQVGEKWFMGSSARSLTFGKTGFTGTSVLCDRARGLGLVILSNRTYPERPPDASSLTSAINIFRADIADIVLQ